MTSSEHNEPRNNLIALYGLISVVGLFLITFLLIYFFSFWRQTIVSAIVEGAPTPELRDLRAREDTALNKYAYLDAATGTVAIPIERAIELEAAAPWRAAMDLPTEVTPEATATPTPAPGATPEPGAPEPIGADRADIPVAGQPGAAIAPEGPRAADSVVTTRSLERAAPPAGEPGS